MAMMNKAFSDAEVASNNYEDGNSPEKVTADFRIRSSTSFFQKTTSGKILLGVATLLFFVCIALIVLLAVGKNKDSDNAAKSNKTNEGKPCFCGAMNEYRHLKLMIRRNRFNYCELKELTCLPSHYKGSE